MKKLFITGLFALAILSSAFAAPNSVNERAGKHFASSYTNAKNVTWTSNDKFEQASFTLDNVQVSVFYDAADGEMIGTTKVMAFDKLPKTALETITTKYTFPEFQLKECIEFVGADNRKSYFVSFEKAKENIVLQISTSGAISIFDRTKK